MYHEMQRNMTLLLFFIVITIFKIMINTFNFLIEIQYIYRIRFVS